MKYVGKKHGHQVQSEETNGRHHSLFLRTHINTAAVSWFVFTQVWPVFTYVLPDKGWNGIAPSRPDSNGVSSVPSLRETNWPYVFLSLGPEYLYSFVKLLNAIDLLLVYIYVHTRSKRKKRYVHLFLFSRDPQYNLFTCKILFLGLFRYY